MGARRRRCRIARPQLADDPRFGTNPKRVANRDALCTIIETALKNHGADHWYSTLTAVSVPAGPINDLSEAFAVAGATPAHDCDTGHVYASRSVGL
ncbi:MULTISPECIES: CoA transferase [unclassified Mycolicibacterium]|uniref:CoA transferase n=1 Tax=unclassified Mycolicibacterium TaxID=2636767 RepID=UPI001309A7D4|nr:MULTISPECIES: CoA transferase [unclassified Mycolicibacterium]MUM42759.1 hypothetical protein [Mycolicibacterium sp. CBMA 294]MUL80928.1 hypothetical protein [Mycolicibacterium sp. CBMA 329]MUL86694.1 hypothetical protein [Mycolicibacterium sp. CBMA 331]MUM02897.1 hypothetical protein [Mycolicibacterium sp. CBMA 334]MUM28852.1 hypothetical protein [Mycolicibacterium sp. CBMA 295]